MVSALLALMLLTEPAVQYRATFENAVHHEASIEAIFSDLPPGVARIKISQSSPGRYALHGFAKNVYSVTARDSYGRPLQVERTGSNEWSVSGHDGTVRFGYTLFADRADGTFSAIDTTHIHLNIPATFVWAAGLEDRPIQLQLEKPAEWKVATQLWNTGDPRTFTAPNLAYFMDSPVEISDHEVFEWQAGSGANRQTFRLALHHAGTREEGSAFAELSRAVVEEELAIFGELPPFEDSRYTFIACYLDHVNGDGMEHRNSTILSSTRSLAEGAYRNLGTVAHEFFHSWNVERIRPRALEPFNFEGPNVSAELWFAEGFTSYYDNLVLRRAGLISLDGYVERLSGILNQVMLSPGRSYRGPAGMSREALFHDAASWIDPSNSENTFISYYGYGAAIGLALDLTLRTRFPGHDLDGLMRAMWTGFGRSEKPYDLKDLQETLGAYSGDSGFAREFFERYIWNGQMPPFESLLSEAGMDLQTPDKEKAWPGRLNLRKQGPAVIVSSQTLRGQPVYEAGLDRGDHILQLGDRKIQEPADFSEIIRAARPGDTIPVRFKRRGQEIESSLQLATNPEVRIVPRERKGSLEPQQSKLREEWLAARSPYRIQTGKHCPQCRRQWPHDYETCPYDGENLRLIPSRKESNR